MAPWSALPHRPQASLGTTRLYSIRRTPVPSCFRQHCASRRPEGPASPATRRRRRQATSCSAGPGSCGAALVLPGFLSSSKQYEVLAAALRAQGYTTEVLPLRLADWLPVLGGSDFSFYTNKLDAALAQLHAQHGKVALVGHSAGGWVARIVLGDQKYQGRVYNKSRMVHTLLTLGTPHQSLEQYPFGRFEEELEGANLVGAPPAVRGSSLKFTNYFYPSADSFPGVRVVSLVGKAIRGQPLWAGSNSGSSSGSGGSSDSNGSSGGSSNESSSEGFDSMGSVLWQPADAAAAAAEPHSWRDAYFAYESYKSGCGQGCVEGDGVTPLETAELPGAHNVIVPGWWHQKRSKQGQFWYGDPQAVAQWARLLSEDPRAVVLGGGNYEQGSEQESSRQ